MIEQKTQKPLPLVSIIIPTLNSAKDLPDCFRSIQAQSYSPLEVIVVDGHSRDASAAIARDHGFHVEQSLGNRMVARMLGVASAKGEFVLFLDSDQVLDPECVANLVNASITENSDALTLFETSQGNSRWHKLLAAEDAIEFELGAGLPRWFRAEVIRESREIPTSMTIEAGEDRLILEWMRLHNRRVGSCKSARISHKDPDMLRFFQKQYLNTFNGAGGHWGGVYAKYAWRSVIRKFDWIGMLRKGTRPATFVAYSMLQIYRMTFQGFGVVAGRIVSQ